MRKITTKDSKGHITSTKITYTEIDLEKKLYVGLLHSIIWATSLIFIVYLLTNG